MKFPLTLSLMATALGSTVFFGESATALPAFTTFQVLLSDTQPTETPMVFVENGLGRASVLWRVSGDDDDEHDDDDDDDDDDDCKDQAVIQSGPVTLPSNGLFTTGTAPQVTSN
ncbi:MAG: hypothetical protein MUQ18_04420 [Loktanella sp.]|nr:hypothetical protein [Loktanella sp.]